jgi:hypothetical protein
MTHDFGYDHIATIRDGQHDPHVKNDSLISVLHDQKTTYYDLLDWTPETQKQFALFVGRAWDVDEGIYQISIEGQRVFIEHRA